MPKPRYQRSKLSHLYLDTKYGVYYVRADDAQGRDTWRSLGTKSFDIAKVRLPQKLAQMQNGKHSSGPVRLEGRETVAEIAAIYRTRLISSLSLKPSTINNYLRMTRAILRSWPQLEELAPDEISEDACLRWAQAYHKEVSPLRFNITVDRLRDIFKLAIELGADTRNPALRIDKRKVTPKKLVLPSRQEFHSIIAAIRSTGAWCACDAADLVEFLAYSGCRITEAAYARWVDVHAKAGTIRIHGHEVTGTKNTEARSIPITPPMRDLLNRISRRGSEPRNLERRGKGFILALTECEEALTNACRKVGAERITHHDLRHLFATRCIEAGVDIPTVSKWLGHRDGGGLCMRTYGHLRDQHSQEMAAKVIF